MAWHGANESGHLGSRLGAPQTCSALTWREAAGHPSPGLPHVPGAVQEPPLPAKHGVAVGAHRRLVVDPHRVQQVALARGCWAGGSCAWWWTRPLPQGPRQARQRLFRRRVLRARGAHHQDQLQGRRTPRSAAWEAGRRAAADVQRPLCGLPQGCAFLTCTWAWLPSWSCCPGLPYSWPGEGMGVGGQGGRAPSDCWCSAGGWRVADTTVSCRYLSRPNASCPAAVRGACCCCCCSRRAPRPGAARLPLPPAPVAWPADGRCGRTPARVGGASSRKGGTPCSSATCGHVRVRPVARRCPGRRAPEQALPPSPAHPLDQRDGLVDGQVVRPALGHGHHLVGALAEQAYRHGGVCQGGALLWELVALAARQTSLAGARAPICRRPGSPRTASLARLRQPCAGPATMGTCSRPRERKKPCASRNCAGRSRCSCLLQPLHSSKCEQSRCDAAVLLLLAAACAAAAAAAAGARAVALWRRHALQDRASPKALDSAQNASRVFIVLSAQLALCTESARASPQATNSFVTILPGPRPPAQSSSREQR